MVRVASDGLLGLLRLDIFPRGRSPARRAGASQFSVFAGQRHPGSRRLDAGNCCRAWLCSLAEFARNFFDLVASAATARLCRWIRLRLRRRAFIYPAALRALHLLPILTEVVFDARPTCCSLAGAA